MKKGRKQRDRKKLLALKGIDSIFRIIDNYHELLKPKAF